MGYNDVIFSALAARKAILIEGIGVVSVVRRGSLRSHPKTSAEFPHYELKLSATSDHHLSLKEEVSAESNYDEWFKGVSKTKKNSCTVDIKGCFLLKMKGNRCISLTPYKELNLLLNPFSNGKEKCKFPFVIVLSVLVILGGLGYIGSTLLSGDFTVSREEEIAVQPVVIQPEIIPVIPEVEVPSDTVQMEEEVEKTDTVTVSEPKISPDGLTEQVIGNSYLVVGSFRSLTDARSDARRLEKRNAGLKISTTKKMKGDYINYIYTSPSFEEAMQKNTELTGKYDKIEGMWVYKMN